MDLTTAIIGLVIIALCALPIIYFSYAQKGERNKFQQHFLALAGQQQLVLTQHELWGHFYAIGIDEKANKLFYIRKHDEQEHKHLVDLGEVEKCRVNKVSKMLNEDPVIDQVELIFSFRNPKKPELTFTIYSRGAGNGLDQELSLVEKWRGLCSTAIGNKKSVAVHA